MTELLGCPFCGKTNTPAVFEFDGEPYVPGYEIRCDASGFDGDPGRGCGAASGWGETVAEATEAWNHRASLPEAPAVPVGVSIKPMKFSDDRCDYFVSFKCGDREVTPHVFRERFKAEYHVALYRWLFEGGEEPKVLEFGADEWPARTYTAEEQRAFAALQSSPPVKAAAVDGALHIPNLDTSISAETQKHLDGIDEALRHGAMLAKGVTVAALASQNAVEGVAVADDNDFHIYAGAELRRLNRTIEPRENQPIAPSCEAAAMDLVIAALRSAGYHITNIRPAAADAGVREGLSEWPGWDQSRHPWGETKHKDAVLEALFRGPWSVEDAAALIGFIDRTWICRPSLAAKREQPR